MESVDLLQQPILLDPEYRNYVWGGERLKPPESPVAEMWAVFEGDRISTGPLAGSTLSQVAERYGEQLLGSRPVRQTGLKFPLLIKLLDCAMWLSVQVHPNDEQAERLEGRGQFGKTEAWYIIDAKPGAELLAGLRPGITHEMLEDAVRGGKILDWMGRYQVKPGDAVFIRSGTVHALGPGLLVYEVQQTSNITYRVFDWNRPASEGRALHIEQSLEVIDLSAAGKVVHLPDPPGKIDPMISCPYFNLEHLNLTREPMELDTQRESFHSLTVIEGDAIVEGQGWQQRLQHFQSVIVPAAAGKYRLYAEGACQVLKSSV